jgi:hypothetical protein
MTIWKKKKCIVLEDRSRDGGPGPPRKGTFQMAEIGIPWLWG